MAVTTTHAPDPAPEPSRAREESSDAKPRAAASPSGPVDDGPASRLASPPAIALPRALQILRFTVRHPDFVFGAQRRLGDVFVFDGPYGRDVVTSHPDHVKALFTADPADVPSVTEDSPLRPVLGPSSVLTSNGPRHLRQRKLLLPSFHGEAVERYLEMIRRAAERELGTWQVGATIAVAPRMQALTLDVIMAGVFGIEGTPSPSTHEARLRSRVRRALLFSVTPVARYAELFGRRSTEATGLMRVMKDVVDRPLFAVIADRRRAQHGGEPGSDVLSLLLQARTEDGEALTGQEIRDELLTLVLAGHETTANTLAWACERLMRTPAVYDRLRDAVRSDCDAHGEVERVIWETMRSRPVIPMVGRRVMRPWQLGEFVVPAQTRILTSILLVHHREELYPEPRAFRPERWAETKPSTYEWIPFGGGTRRCLGASLAMAEQQIVLEAIVRRFDLRAEDEAPEQPVMRNVTMIPRRGARAVVAGRLA